MSRIVTIRDELERQIEAARRRWSALQAEADSLHLTIKQRAAKVQTATQKHWLTRGRECSAGRIMELQAELATVQRKWREVQDQADGAEHEYARLQGRLEQMPEGEE